MVEDNGQLPADVAASHQCELHVCLEKKRDLYGLSELIISFKTRRNSNNYLGIYCLKLVECHWICCLLAGMCDMCSVEGETEGSGGRKS